MMLSAKFKSCAAAAAVLAACLLLPGNQAKAEAAPTPAREDTAQSAAVSAPQAQAQTPPAPRYLPARMEAATQTPDEPAAPEEADVPADEAAAQAQPEEEAVSAIALATKADVEAPEDLVKLGDFIATAYCVTGQTSTGTQTTVGRTLAVNPYVIPYGTEVWLYLEDGSFVGDFVAEDTGSNMLANSNVIDIYMGEGSYHDCILWGAQNVQVYARATSEAASGAES